MMNCELKFAFRFMNEAWLGGKLEEHSQILMPAAHGASAGDC